MDALPRDYDNWRTEAPDDDDAISEKHAAEIEHLLGKRWEEMALDHDECSEWAHDVVREESTKEWSPITKIVGAIARNKCGFHVDDAELVQAVKDIIDNHLRKQITEEVCGIR